jgi:hypothetical protein
MTARLKKGGVPSSLMGSYYKTGFNQKIRVNAARSTVLQRAKDYTGDSRRQGAAIKKLGSQGVHPQTGKYVGKKRAARVARRIGDMANE